MNTNSDKDRSNHDNQKDQQPNSFVKESPAVSPPTEQYEADACEDFYVVGIGASAGGLSALSELVESLPVNVDAAYVVVQHLSPDFESQMPKLLESRTSMPLHHAQDNQQLEPNHIYFIPPGKTLMVSGRRLFLSNRDPDESLVLPIDHFFRSMAQDVGRFSIGVVLTGSGGDGSRGVVDVEAAGGLVIAQSLDTAAHPSMPRKAIESGKVHLQLPPKGIGDAIGRYISESLSPQKLSDEEFAKKAEDEVDSILGLLHQQYSIDFSQYKPTTINRRIERRMDLSPQENLDDYLRRLKTDEPELNELYKDLLIGVTSFFRDEAAFEIMKKTVIPELVERSSQENPIRIWTPGCASGEEAYSLAILLREELHTQDKDVPVKIFATDVHPKSLSHASSGVYSENSLSNVPAELKEKYFLPTEDGDTFTVSPNLRQMIIFARHDLLSDPPFTRMNMIVCRNMLIYIQPASQQKCLSVFHFALNTAGILFLGPSETVGELDDEFETIDRKWRILRKRRDVKLAIASRRSSAVPSARFDSDGLKKAQSAVHLELAARADATKPSPQSEDQLHKEMLQRFMPPSFLVDERANLLQTYGGGQRFLQIGDGRIRSRLIDLVPEDLKAFVDGAINRVFQEQERVTYDRVEVNGVNVRVSAELVGDHDQQPRAIVTIVPLRDYLADIDDGGEQGSTPTHHVKALQGELRSTRDNLNATVEELEASNEELQATNEELAASNEEMQSTNEELQSVNEQLHSLNLEHARKIDELTELTGDMNNLFMATDIGVLFLDPELRIRRTTPVMDEIFNLLPQDIGRNIADFSHNITGVDLEQQLRKVLFGGGVFESEVVDLELKTWLLRILPYSSNADSQLDGLVVTLVNVEMLKKQEVELRRYADIVESSGEAILAKDLDGKITHWNSGAIQLYGYSASEAIGSSVKLIVPDDRHDEIDDILESARNGRSVQLDTIRRNQNGDELNIRLSVSPIFDSNQKVIGASAVGHDYTKRVKAEAESRIFKRAVDASPVGVIVTDATSVDNPIIYINQNFTDMTGYSEEHSIGQNCRFLQGPGTDTDTIAKLRNAIRTGTSCRVSLLNYRKNGTPFWNELNVAPIPNADGEVTHFIGIQSDITKQVDFEQKLDIAKREAEKANVAKTIFLSNMSHDIRTPLTTVIGIAEILRDEESDERRNEMLELVVRSGKHLSELISGILELSKIESGTLPVANEPCSPVEIVEDVIAVMKTQAMDKGIELNLSTDDSLPQTINSDSLRLRRIVFNLVGNAVKFTDEGSVDVSIKRGNRVPNKDEIRIVVSDTGQGISAESLEQIFEPFVQVEGQGERA